MNANKDDQNTCETNTEMCCSC